MGGGLTMKAAVILHGDTERGDLYWCGYDRTRKDHKFSRNPNHAIKFLTRRDAERAGVGLTKGVRIEERELPPEGLTSDASSP
jgi:hypothetical protein